MTKPKMPNAALIQAQMLVRMPQATIEALLPQLHTLAADEAHTSEQRAAFSALLKAYEDTKSVAKTFLSLSST